MPKGRYKTKKSSKGLKYKKKKAGGKKPRRAVK